jgi:hypothetical protein
VRTEPTKETGRLTHRSHLPTVVLEEHADGNWRATQRGVSVESPGTTAAAAAVKYCRAVGDRAVADRG